MSSLETGTCAATRVATGARGHAIAGAASFALACIPFVAAAQEEPSPEAVAAAARAYSAGQLAQVNGDEARAAEMFELAHRSAPNSAALRSAIRMHRSAGHVAHAATLALEARELYANEANTLALATSTIAELEGQLARIEITCDPACTVSVDGLAFGERAGTRTSLFVDAGHHSVVASWRERSASSPAESFDGAGGSSHAFSFTPPAVAATPAVTPDIATTPAAEPETTSTPASSAPPVEVDRGSSSGLSPAFFAIGAGLTAVSLGVAIGFGVDMLSARDAYVAAPTETGWRDGVGRELRTNVMIGTTIGLAALTLTMALLTDWDGAPASGTAAHESAPRFAFGASPDGAYGSLELDL